MSIQITLDIPADVIANLMISAIESGDPVTTARKGGWCDGIYWHSKGSTPPFTGPQPWYSNPKFYDAGDFQIEVIEVDDETTGHKTAHQVDQDDLTKGLAVMAKKFPELFAQVLQDNTDAPCADIFLQCVLFGEEKYA